MAIKTNTVFPTSFNATPSVGKVCSPVSKYIVDKQLSLTTLQDELEKHLAMYDYHQTALLTLTIHDEEAENAEWKFGAFLLGQYLRQQSGVLMERLSEGENGEISTD